MKISKIRTVRKFETWPSWHLVYEWEDVFRERLNIPFRYVGQINEKATKGVVKILYKMGVQILTFFFKSRDYEFYWDMWAATKNRSDNRSNLIPCIVDFFIQKDQLPFFLRAYSKPPFILISSAEAFAFLKENNVSKDFYHFPLSISDIYRITADTRYAKTYDLVLFGRTNSVLNGFLDIYVRKHPDFIYVFEKVEERKFLYYTSAGNLVGDISTREQYMDLMRKSKMGLYSTPGIDGGEKRTNGFNQVTPKFLELLSCGCHIIARYEENQDTEYYKLKEFSPSINSYEAFEKAVDLARNNDVDMEKYAIYLEQHYTSKRVELLNEILKKYN